MGGPGLANESVDDDNGIRQGEAGLDDLDPTLGADQHLPEPSVMPGVGVLDNPLGARTAPTRPSC